MKTQSVYVQAHDGLSSLLLHATYNQQEDKPSSKNHAQPISAAGYIFNSPSKASLLMEKLAHVFDNNEEV